jgi:hypothetical protein
MDTHQLGVQRRWDGPGTSREGKLVEGWRRSRKEGRTA